MNICGHIIKNELIIGISPLYSKDTSEGAYRATVRPVMLIFEIHTVPRTIEIKSDWFKVGYDKTILTPEIEQGRKFYKEFEDQYYALRKEIAALIGEPIEEQNRFDEKPTADNGKRN